MHLLNCTRGLVIAFAKELSMSQGSPLRDENVAAIDNANLYCPCK